MALDKLLALRYFTRPDIIVSQRAATEHDLPSFFYDAMSESIDELSKKLSEALPDEKENDS